MQLLVDIGNTRVKWTVAQHDILGNIEFASSYDLFKEQVAIILPSISSAIFSTVVTYANEIKQDFSCIKNKILLDYTTPIPIINQYKTPQSLGNDRLCNVIAAQSIFMGKSVLVIDCGTCIKYDFITKHKEYVGGSIAPGLHMRYSALHDFTKRLPLLEPTIPAYFIGNTTESSMHTGIMQAILLEMSGFIELYSKQYGDLTIIITGGDAHFFANQLNYKIFANQNLVLLGLKKILDYNVDTK